ncbi:MAG: hypothetical protein A2751_04695 [Candidatus Doudnabacteria bacterium RIFCSPHIGHO2_01_FULL_46_14]|uniref:tRNA/rRNA methyltransferase SpoU type domain-containing protein n=1 Tax=Candidatus Doudnabacteria bacterium RIFCSPHIGHO2_01_FULL_46_14 TaxID=1817824 RepID=A0A1F5NPG0_9BACT|nr:MAG: hypothetical protein A2751_04695 [Candidatus Doudnabacteria bacterium RIFCSPHIGHO2_01_FULL_46_14]
MVAVLHNVRSSFNVGSIFRTADAAGFEKMILCGITPAPVGRFGKVNAELAKVALGAEKYIAWEYKKSAISAIKKLKKQGYYIAVLEQSRNSVPYSKFNPSTSGPNSKFCLVVGNEISGLPRSVLKMADKILEIPMHGRKESLNVAVAFGIVSFKIVE